MHIGILAAAAHAAANNSPFTVFYNPRFVCVFIINVSCVCVCVCVCVLYFCLSTTLWILNFIFVFIITWSVSSKLYPKLTSYICRACPSEFVIPLAKYQKAVYSNQISLGMRFRMMFETEESGTRR